MKASVSNFKPLDLQTSPRETILYCITAKQGWRLKGDKTRQVKITLNIKTLIGRT